MRQAFHIFKKDVRYLWPEISIVLAATVAFTVAATRRTQSPALLAYALPASWWALMARLTYAEPLVGESEFWVTRPYSRRSLLASKALFVAAFVLLPKFLADALMMHASGFRVWRELDGLLWSQILLAAGFVLPVIALCAVTTGFAQLIAAGIVLFLAVAGWYLWTPGLGADAAPWLAMEWVRWYSTGLVVATAALAIVLLQYLRRDTARSRLLAGGAGLVAFGVFTWFPWTAAFALQARLSSQTLDASRVRVEFDHARQWVARALPDRDNLVNLDIPLRVSGVPAPLGYKVEGIAASIEGATSATWRTDQAPPSHVRTTGDVISFHARLNPSFYGKVKDGPVRLRGTAYLTTYGNPRRTALPIRDVAEFVPTPGAGLCSAIRTGRGIAVTCRSTSRPQPGRARFDVLPAWRFAAPFSISSDGFLPPASYSPFPADPSLVPVTQATRPAQVYGPMAGVTVHAVEPVAHFSVSFEITGLRLADFEPKLPAVTDFEPKLPGFTGGLVTVRPVQPPPALAQPGSAGDRR